MNPEITVQKPLMFVQHGISVFLSLFRSHYSSFYLVLFSFLNLVKLKF